MTNPFQQPLLGYSPNMEPPGWDLLRDMLMRKIFTMQGNPYGYNPKNTAGAGGKPASMESLWTGKGRGLMDPKTGQYPSELGTDARGPVIPPSSSPGTSGANGIPRTVGTVASPGSGANPTAMAGRGGSGPAGGGGVPRPGGGAGRPTPGGVPGNPGTPGGGPWRPDDGRNWWAYGDEARKPRSPNSGNAGGARDGRVVGYDAPPPQVDPANYGNSFDTVTKWLMMNPGNHGAYGTTPSHANPNNPYGMGGGGATAPPPASPPPTTPATTAPRATPAIPRRNPNIPQGYPTPFDRNTSTVSRTPTGPAPTAPPPSGGAPPRRSNPKFPNELGNDSPYMFQHGPQGGLGSDGAPPDPDIGPYEAPPRVLGNREIVASGSGISGRDSDSLDDENIDMIAQKLMERPAMLPYIKAKMDMMKHRAAMDMEPRRKIYPRIPSGRNMKDLGHDDMGPGMPGPIGAMPGSAPPPAGPSGPPGGGSDPMSMILAMLLRGGGGGGGGGVRSMKRRKPVLGMDGLGAQDNVQGSDYGMMNGTNPPAPAWGAW